MHISPTLSPCVPKKPLFCNKQVIHFRQVFYISAASENRTRACSLARSRPTIKLWPLYSNLIHQTCAMLAQASAVTNSCLPSLATFATPARRFASAKQGSAWLTYQKH
jgi:hypothetical protein